MFNLQSRVDCEGQDGRQDSVGQQVDAESRLLVVEQQSVHVCCNRNHAHVHTEKSFFFAFLVMKTSGILFFGPSFRQPARKASSGEIYLKNKDLYATDL